MTPEEAVAAAYERLAALDDHAAVISLVPSEITAAKTAALDNPSLPLYGVPFAVKDNIDVAGVPTTAGCPAYAYTPDRSAEVVRRLEAAGAIAVAKTNLDQFATGLVGTRSPYGVPLNPWDPARVPGGSSSGSAIVVARGAVPFALGTDTAGSGRIPAAFTGIVGAKPTRGWLSTAGVVPAVRTIDCVSVFALTIADVWVVFGAAGGFDSGDPYSRRPPPPVRMAPSSGRVGVADVVGAGVGAVATAAGLVGIEVDLEPFLTAGRLLYGGPWVAERLAVLGDFMAAHPGDVEPIVGAIITAAAKWSAADAARAGYELAALKRRIDRIWEDVDALVLPTAPLPPTLAAVSDDPIGANAALGTYTTFTNLLDLCAIAVPTGTADGLPTSVQVVGPAWADSTVAAIADRIHLATGGLQGVTGTTRAGAPFSPATPAAASAATVDVAVVGAHLRGQPFHHQLTDLGAKWVADTRTAPCYRLYALADTSPPKPGLVRVDSGKPIAVEVYRLTFEAFGRLVAGVPAPMCIGTVVLEHGAVAGFLCEPAAIAGATDITSFGGWQAYLSSRA
jgi:allophanate hydrolase